MIQRNVGAVILLVMVLSGGILSPSTAADPLSIQSLIAQARVHELHIVTLHGVIRRMLSLPPTMLSEPGCLLDGKATFVLEDDTGSLPVEVLGSCIPQTAVALPSDGDQVVLSAVVHISTAQLPVKVWAQATEIRLIVDSAK